MLGVYGYGSVVESMEHGLFFQKTWVLFLWPMPGGGGGGGELMTA